MKLATKKTTLIMLSTIFLPVAANGRYSDIKKFSVRGSGCGLGSVSAELSNDNKLLSIFYKDFNTSSDDRNNRRSRKHCKVKVSLNGPSNHYLKIKGIEFAGSINLPKGASAYVSSEYFLDRSRIGKKFFKKWGIAERKTDDDFELFYPTDVTSKCSGNATITANNTIGVLAGDKDDGYIEVSNVSNRPGLNFIFEWKKCN